MKRILIIANTARFLVLFEKNNMKILQQLGYEVHCASNFAAEKDIKNAKQEIENMGVAAHQIDIVRTPVSIQNFYAYRQLCQLMREITFDAVHCHTPMGAVAGRLAAQRAGIKTVLYTVHGFHFYQGASFWNCTAFKWIEQALAHWTDVLITINQEDYEAAQKFHLRKNGRLYKIHGVGIDVSAYENPFVDSKAYRKNLGLAEEDFVCISAGDLMPGKNYKTAIEAIALTGIKNMKYLICGDGPERENLKTFVKEKGLEEQVQFLGFRKDVKELMKTADCFLFTTLREGLPRSMMEAMASGLPCIVSRIRGNMDLMEEGKGGWFCEAADSVAFFRALMDIMENPAKAKRMGRYNLEKIREFDCSVVEQEMKLIYQRMSETWRNE